MIRRPWYAYLLLAPGVLGLLVALFRPMVGMTSTEPGAFVTDAAKRMYVRPGSPLSRAGAQTGDVFVQGDSVELSGGDPSLVRQIVWTRGIPRSGPVTIRRAGRDLRVEVRPAPPSWPVRLAWSLLGLLNASLAALGLALLWQRARDGAAVLFGLVLISAPVFAFPREPQLLALAFSAHFFTVFPPAAAPASRLRRGFRALGIYLPLAFFGLVGTGLWESGKREQAAGLFDVMAIAYSLYSCVRVAWRGAARTAGPRDVELTRTLLLAALAILAAVLVGASQRLWVINNQFVPLNLLPALIFAVAVAHLVFRLQVMQVRVVARRTLQYVLARWTLGTLFLLPGFLFVFHLGQQSQGGVGGTSVVPYLLWMLLAAVLLRKRHDVLRRLDRRFFKDTELRRERLLRLAREVGELSDPDAVVDRLLTGLRDAFGPVEARFEGADESPVLLGGLRLPLRHHTELLGYLEVVPPAGESGFSSEEQQMLAAVCAQAATALNYARISRALLSRQRDELGVRTAGVLAGAEEERRRLAADLHDQVLPELRRLAAQAELIRTNGSSATDLQSLEDGIRETMGSVREVMEALRPSALDLLGLSAALESYLRNSSRAMHPSPAVSVLREGPEPELGPDESLGLYRICQEAINNACKHSGASKIGLQIRSDDEGVEIRIWDDGRGMQEDPSREGGHGLRNMRYRADLIGGQVDWRRQEVGVEVVVRLAIGRCGVPMLDGGAGSGGSDPDR